MISSRGLYGSVLKRCALVSAVVAVCLISGGVLTVQPVAAGGKEPTAAAGGSPQSKHAKPAAAEKTTGKPKIVELGAVWCVPCKKFAPIFEKAKTIYGGKADFQSLDFDKPDGKAFVQKYEISAVPAVVMIDGAGKVVYKHVGELDEATFDAQVTKVAH